MTNRLGDARDALYAALTPVFVDPIDGWTFAGRLHRTNPGTLAAPSVWIGESSGNPRTSPPVYLAEFPVWVVYDGNIAAQVDGLEEVVSRIHDAACRAGLDPLGHEPATPPPPRSGALVTNLSAAIVTVGVTVRGRTLCNPSVVMEAPANV